MFALENSINTNTYPLPTSVQPISITKTLRIVPTKNERDPPLFTGKLLIKFQNILRNTTQVIIRIPFIFDDFHFCRCSRVIGLDMTENMMFTLCRMITWVVFLRIFWVNIIFSVISCPITLERQKWKSSKMKEILLSSPVSCW
jgi:hypothetical protein